jgi:HK97 family phage portal protein
MSIGRILAGAWLSEDNPAIWTGTSGFIGSSQAGVNVTAEKAMMFRAYFAGVRNYAEDLAKLPLILYRRLPGGGRERATDHPAAWLATIEPNHLMTPMAFKEVLHHWAPTWGRGPAEIEFDSRGRPAALWPIHPSRVELKRVGPRRYVYEVYLDDLGLGSLRKVRLETWQVLDLHGLGDDGLTGYKIPQLAREAIGLGIAAEQFGARFFGRGANPSMVLIHPKKLGPGAADEYRERWSQLYGGIDNAGKVAVLPEDMKVQKLSALPNESQMIETRRAQLEEVAGYLRMPLSKMGVAVAYTDVDKENRAYVTDCLQSWATRFEQEYNRKLLTPDERGEYYFQFLFDALLRGDPTARANIHRTQIMSGMESVNEARETEDRNGIGEAGDVYWMPMNIQSIERAATDPATGPTGDPKNPDSGVDTSPDGNPDNNDPNAPPDPQKSARWEPLLTAAFERVLRKQAKALEQRAGQSAPELQAWADGFFDSQRLYLVAELTPIFEASGSPGIVVFGLASEFVLESRDHLNHLGGGNVEQLSAYWRDSAATWSVRARALMEET